MNLQMRSLYGNWHLMVPIVLFFLMVQATQFTLAQPNLPEKLANTDLEEVGESEAPASWNFFGPAGRTVKVDQDNPFSGARSGMINATEITDQAASSSFANLMQALDGSPYRGKKVRFRAAVRTAELSGGTAQLWFRVDRQAVDDNGRPIVGAFDNMGNRPITNGDWKHLEIVLQIDDDAKQITVGLLMIGTGKAWLDDVSFEIVDEATPSTGASPTVSMNRSNSGPVNSQQALANAFREAEHAAQQPFFVSWLWLVLITLVLFGMSQYITPFKGGQSNDWVTLGFASKFGLRFSIAYWLFYSLPAPFVSVLPIFGGTISQLYANWVDQAVRWTALHVLGMEQTLVSPNGSGDTTFAYVNVLLCFVLAIAVAAIWTMFDRRRTDYRIAKDLLRSYLRYVLAFTLLSYGLAKVGSVSNQFPEVGTYQLTKTYGDSSPMNLLWTFMGATCRQSRCDLHGDLFADLPHHQFGMAICKSLDRSARIFWLV